MRPAPLAAGRIRREGSGRRALTDQDPGLAPALDALVEPGTRGDPESPSRWLCKSTRTLSAELFARRHPAGHAKVAELLREGGYSLQGNRKTEEGEDHPDRVAQFRRINRSVKRAPRVAEPVVSVDTEKADHRRRRWKQRLAPAPMEMGASATGRPDGLGTGRSPFPPGTSQWNKVEHRLFSFISSNWRGEPPRDYETIVRLIAATTTAKGLKATCRLDHHKYPAGRKVTDEEMARVNLKPERFHGEWNYTIQPNIKR